MRDDQNYSGKRTGAMFYEGFLRGCYGVQTSKNAAQRQHELKHKDGILKVRFQDTFIAADKNLP